MNYFKEDNDPARDSSTAQMGQLVTRMRQMVEELREENVKLQRENAHLMEQLKRVRPARNAFERHPTRRHPDLNELSDASLLTMLGLDDEQLPPSVTDIPTSSSYVDDPYAPGASILKPPRLGKGVQPEVALARGVQPAVAMGRPNVDLGYINDVPADELDALPYGLIVLDREGAVLFYNETESQMAGFAKEQVVGRNFFQDVAPCTRIQAFQGRFESFVRGELGRVTFFDFAFHFEHGTQNVVIGLSHGRRRGHFNVMLMRQ